MKTDKDKIEQKANANSIILSKECQNKPCLKSKVEYLISDDLLLIKCKIEECSYKISFGYVFICNNPDRIELYKKFCI